MRTDYAWLLLIREPEDETEACKWNTLFENWKFGVRNDCQIQAEQLQKRLRETANEKGFLLLLKREAKDGRKLQTAIGEAEVSAQGDSFEYQLVRQVDAPLAVHNLLADSDVELSREGTDVYVYLERSGQMLQQVEFLVYGEAAPKRNGQQSYQERDEEKHLAEYAQRNRHCERMWGLSGSARERSEFQRDRERIVNSKAFRRLVDKAQIFTSSKGDHYRTRMTHTLEVAQIARSIANSLGLNIDLTEAVALGHDIGHTPFGHQGERTLDDILKGTIDIGQCRDERHRNIYGGFKHNFQSVRVLSVLEEKYPAYSGLDVSFQVLEGVLKHTNCHFRDCAGCSYGTGTCKKGCCDLKEFMDGEYLEYLYPQYPNATTLEGQVVAMADEIAQRSHDLDDAFSSGLLRYEEFLDYLSFESMAPLRELIQNTYDSLEKCGRSLIDFNEMLYSRIISDVIHYLANDAICESRVRIRNFLEKGGNWLYTEKHRFSEKLIEFSKQGGEICSLLEKLITKKAINCLEVTWFDRNAENIVKRLFEAYYENPRLMHNGTLRKMYLDMRRQTENALDFLNAGSDAVRQEFSRIRTARYDSKEDKEKYWVKNRILMRCIADYIAGMTDSYAINEYERLKK